MVNQAPQPALAPSSAASPKAAEGDEPIETIEAIVAGVIASAEELEQSSHQATVPAGAPPHISTSGRATRLWQWVASMIDYSMAVVTAVPSSGDDVVGTAMDACRNVIQANDMVSADGDVVIKDGVYRYFVAQK